MIRTICFLVLAAFGSYEIALAQDRDMPVIGEALPEFTLDNVNYYIVETVNNKSFEGKWLLLHFWSLGCRSAIESLDKANEIQRKYKDDLQVMLVGYNRGSQNAGIETVIERKNATTGVYIPVAYDTVLFEEWSLKGVPIIYIVDPGGTLRYITAGSDLTLQKVADIIAGKNVSLRSLDFDYTHFDASELFNENISFDNVVYSSVLTQWNGEYPKLGYEFDRFVSLPNEYKKMGWSVKFATLERLYQYAYYGQGWFSQTDSAYYGKVFEKPILEVSDETPFTGQDFESGRGYYNYFLKLPLPAIDKTTLMKEMQHMLNNNFEYEAVLEVRKLPVWQLEAGPNAERLLESKGRNPGFVGVNPVAGVKVQNYTIRDFLRLVIANLPNDEVLPYLDNTGIDVRIDANIQADMTNLGSVQEALSQYDLSLVKSKKEMKVLVIRDK